MLNLKKYTYIYSVCPSYCKTDFSQYKVQIMYLTTDSDSDLKLISIALFTSFPHLFFFLKYTPVFAISTQAVYTRTLLQNIHLLNLILSRPSHS